jgi:hypothetical protein
MPDDALGDDLVIDEAFIDKVKVNGGRGLDFSWSSDDEREKLRDEHVITIIDNHFEADEVTHIYLDDCVGITDATLAHIATNCTQLERLGVYGCVKITDDGITAIVEKIGNKLTYLGYGNCSRCTDAALQAVVHHCPNLEALGADNAGITHIPESIGQDLPRLELLYLSNNRIERLPPSITLLDKLEEYFYISENPLQHPPLEIAEQEIQAISEYFASNERRGNNSDPQLESSLLYHAFLTHNWGSDSQGRNNHDRVVKFKKHLESKHNMDSLWLDEERMTGNIVDQMCAGIDKSRYVIVFVTQRYIDKVAGRGENGDRDNCHLEFNYAAREKGPSKMIAVVMEDVEWGGPVEMYLGGELYFSFKNDSELQKCAKSVYEEIQQRMNK